MHKFYITNNLGGGGTNVSRFVDYSQLFKQENIGLLLNYYYLKSKPSYDIDLLRDIEKSQNIEFFLNAAKKHFAQKRDVSTYFHQETEPTNISSYILDNGCGNIVRDLLTSKTYNSATVRRIIKPFHDFADQQGFDFVIALDNAMKYTYRNKETQDRMLMQLWTDLAKNEESNLLLLSTTLDILRKNGYKNHKTYAPLHGFNYDSFEDYLVKILDIENKRGTQFDGFALGGIGDTRKLNDNIWAVPNGVKNEAKTGYIVSKLCQKVRGCTTKPIHVLGAGNIFVLPFIIKAGATSSDCHSAWRRSSDGGYEKAKILIPLLNNDLEFINDRNVLKYVKIRDVNNCYHFNSEYPISDIVRLLQSANKEDYYCAEILIFYEAIRQYDLLIRFTERYPNDYISKLTCTPDHNFNTTYEQLANILNI